MNSLCITAAFLTLAAVAAAAPVITSLAPTRGLASEATSVVITGQEFGLNPSITFNGVAATVTISTATSLTVSKPVDSGGDLAVVVVASGQSSNSKIFRSVALTSLPGYYVDLLAEVVVPAPLGRYSDLANLTAAKLAPAGFYAPVPGMTAAIPSSPGYFVNSNGAITQQPAPVGQFVALPGVTSPTPVPAGYYGPIIGLQAPIPAPAGTYAPNPGAAQPLPVPPGYTTNGLAATSITSIPQVNLTAYSLGVGTAQSVSFETLASQNYGIFHPENLQDYILLETVAGTGGVVSRAFDPLVSITSKRFYIVAPVR